jgi:hypothetical protein
MTAVDPRRTGGTTRRGRSSKASVPQRSPTTSATAAMATAASTATSSRVASPRGARMSLPASSRSSRSRSRSTRNWLAMVRPTRAVARQLTWRISSSGTASRIDSKSVPRPSGPRRSCPASRKRPSRTARAMRRAPGTSGCTTISPSSPARPYQRPSPSGPVPPHGRRGQDVQAAPPGRQRAGEDPVGLRGARARGREAPAGAGAASRTVLGRADHEVRGPAADQDGRRPALERRSAAGLQRRPPRPRARRPRRSRRGPSAGPAPARPTQARSRAARGEGLTAGRARPQRRLEGVVGG